MNSFFQRIKLASLISVLFNPMLVSFVTFGILIFDHPIISVNAYFIFFSCFLFSNFIPFITVLFLKITGKISDLDASQKEQRLLPLFLGVLYAGFGFIVLNFLNAGDLVRGLMFCYMTNTIVIIIITKYWKISIHAAGVAGPLTALWIHGIHSPFVVIFIATLLGWARIILKAHNISQVLTGFILGSFLTGIQLITLFQFD